MDDTYDGQPDMELAVRLHSLEAVMWWMQHDAADGRIDDIDDDLAELEEKRTRIADELYERTGYEEHEEVASYVQELVDTYEDVVGRYEQDELEEPFTAEERRALELYDRLND